jgi:hypothetical protein
MNSRYVYPFAFLLRQHDLSRRLRAFQIRDGAATLEIVTALAHLGWEYGHLLLNFPPHAATMNEQDLLDVHTPAGPGDRIASTTRPPLLECGKKQVSRGWTQLEAHVLNAWKPFFAQLNRHEILLATKLHDELAPGYENRRHIFFRTREGADYFELGPLRYRGRPRTAAFLLHTRELYPGGPGYIGIFGMDGTTTLIWAHMLRTRHRDLLATPGFVMAEIETGAIPLRTTDLGFARSWETKVILHHAL